MQKRIAIHSSLEPLALPPHLSRTDGGDAKHPGVNSLPGLCQLGNELEKIESKRTGPDKRQNHPSGYGVRASYGLPGTEALPPLRRSFAALPGRFPGRSERVKSR